MRTFAALRRFAGGLLLLVGASTANALVIDFEGEIGSAAGIGTFIDIDGFRFTITGANGFEIITAQNDLVEPNTTKLFGANHVEITMTKIGGGAFTLGSLDIGGSFVANPDRWADHVDVISGATVTATLAGHAPTYVHLTPNFSNVTSVLFDPFVNANQGVNNFEFTIDNIVIAEAAAVPEPSSLALLAFGLAAMGFRRRIVLWRRENSQSDRTLEKRARWFRSSAAAPVNS